MNLFGGWLLLACVMENKTSILKILALFIKIACLKAVLLKHFWHRLGGTFFHAFNENPQIFETYYTSVQVSTSST